MFLSPSERPVHILIGGTCRCSGRHYIVSVSSQEVEYGIGRVILGRELALFNHHERIDPELSSFKDRVELSFLTTVLLSPPLV